MSTDYVPTELRCLKLIERYVWRQKVERQSGAMHRLAVFDKADYRLKQVGCAKSVETDSENGREIRGNVLRLQRYSYTNDTKWMVFGRTNLSHNDVNSLLGLM